ncbi:MAG: hypothetical protein ACI4EA_02575 [Candidatus Ornithomonoglobus sp.]
MIKTDITIKNISVTDNEAEALKRNIEFYCSTPRGSLPQMRNYGLDFSVIGESYSAAKRKLTVDIISGVRDTFGVQISRIDVDADENGRYTATIIL